MNHRPHVRRHCIRAFIVGLCSILFVVRAEATVVTGVFRGTIENVSDTDGLAPPDIFVGSAMEVAMTYDTTATTGDVWEDISGTEGANFDEFPWPTTITFNDNLAFDAPLGSIDIVNRLAGTDEIEFKSGNFDTGISPASRLSVQLAGSHDALTSAELPESLDLDMFTTQQHIAFSINIGHEDGIFISSSIDSMSFEAVPEPQTVAVMLILGSILLRNRMRTGLARC